MLFITNFFIFDYIVSIINIQIFALYILSLTIRFDSKEEYLTI